MLEGEIPKDLVMGKWQKKKVKRIPSFIQRGQGSAHLGVDT